MQRLSDGFRLRLIEAGWIGTYGDMPSRRESEQQRVPPGRAAKAERPVVIGSRVRELYEARGWTQQELAWRANLSLPKVSRVILEQQGIGASALLRLATCLGTSLDYLVGLTDDKRPRQK